MFIVEYQNEKMNLTALQIYERFNDADFGNTEKDVIKINGMTIKSNTSFDNWIEKYLKISQMWLTISIMSCIINLSSTTYIILGGHQMPLIITVSTLIIILAVVLIPLAIAESKEDESYYNEYK